MRPQIKLTRPQGPPFIFAQDHKTDLEQKMPTICRHCNKSYVNVKQHITKSHSYLQITCKEDGKIVDGPLDELFWKDQIWKNDHYSRVCDSDDEIMDNLVSMGPIQGHLWVHMKRSTLHPTMWIIIEINHITLIKNDTDTKTTRYTYPAIQVLHKRI